MGERIAEWMLELVLTPEHAASAIGDWKESSKPLWLYVLRTMASQIQSDFIENPGFMIWLGIRGYLFSVLMLVAFMGLVIIRAMPVTAVLTLPFRWEIITRSVLVALIGWTIVGYSMFIAGKWVARRAPGREMSGFIATWLVPQTFLTLGRLIAMHFWGSQIKHFLMPHQPAQGDSSYSLILGREAILYICLFAGAMRQRRKFLRRVAL